MDAKQRTEIVETLLTKATNAPVAFEAVNFAQAALNAANALRALTDSERRANNQPRK